MDGSAGLFTSAERLNWTPSSVLPMATLGLQICFHPGTRHLFPLPLPRCGASHPLAATQHLWIPPPQKGLSGSFQELSKLWIPALSVGALCLPHCSNDSFLSFSWRSAAVCLQVSSSKSPFHHSSSCLPALPAQCLLPAAFALWQDPQASEIPRDRAAQAEETVPV